MDSPLGSSPRRRKFGKPGAAAAGAGPFAWPQRHPMAAAAFYMLIGGCVVYGFLNSSQQRQQQQRDGIVRLAAMAPPSVNPAPPAPGTFKAAKAAAQAELCLDTCFKAKDGICDDGRFLHNMTRGLSSTVLCDLGTDCSDCGPWKGVQHSSAWKEPMGPVEFLRQHNLTVLTKKAAFEPHFHFAFTDPQHDIDASKDFAGFSTLEQRLSHIAYHVLHGLCQQGADVDTTSSSSSSSSETLDNNSSSSDVNGQQEQQQHQGASEGLVLDVGAGFGWYSLMAGMLGCRVIAWEPVKIFQAYMEYSIARNRLQHKIDVRAAALVAPTGPSSSTTAVQKLLQQRPEQRQQQTRRKLSARQTPQQQQQQAAEPSADKVTVVAPTRGLWGTASISGRSIYLELSSGGAFHKYDVPAETLDAVVLPLLSARNASTRPQQQQQQGQDGAAGQPGRRHSRIALLKVDIEGHEPQAIAGAAGLLEEQIIDNVLLEYAPHFVEMHNISQTAQYPQMLLRLLKAGFNLGHVSDMNYFVRPLSTYSEPLHQLQAITEANLKYELFDSMQMTEVGLTWLHEPCREMLSYGLISESIPERLHPKSFRSTFGINTHVWATRQQRYVPYVKGPPVGVFPLDRKLTDSWFVEETSVLDRGMGGRSCKNLREVAATENLDDNAKAAFLISHRCRCAVGGNSPCEDKEQLAESCAQSGRTPFREEADYVADRK